MGTVYRYANHDLRQSFDCGLGRWNDKWSGVGRGPGARVLGILLNGPWANCRIALVGDSSDEWSELQAKYEDVTVAAAVLLLENDGLKAWLDLDDPLDLQFAGDLAIHLKLRALADQLDLNQKNWRQLHAKLPPNSFTVDVLEEMGRRPITD